MTSCLWQKNNKELSQSGSNSISILVKKGYRFDKADLSGISIPHANLSYGVFYKTNFINADLTDCNLSCAQFLDVSLNGAKLPNIKLYTDYLPQKIHSVAISHSESWIAVCQKNKIIVYDTYDSKLKNECSEESINYFLQIVSWSYDDKFIASCDWAGAIFIWEWDDSKSLNNLIEKIQPQQGSLTKVLWAPNDYKIASCRGDGVIKIWNAITKENIFEEHHDILITTLAWSNFGKYLAYYCGNMNEMLWIWNSETNEQILSHKASELYALEWIHNEKCLAFGGKEKKIYIWKISTEEIYEFSNKSESPIKALKWMDTLSLLAVGDFDGSITIWNINEKENKTPFITYHIGLFIFCHSLDVSCLSWSGKNHILVSGSADETFKVWQINPEERKGGIGDTEETHSLGEYCENENDSTKNYYIEKLLWCSEAYHFIQTKARTDKYFILPS